MNSIWYNHDTEFFKVGDKMAIYTFAAVFLSSFIPLMVLFSMANRKLRIGKAFRIIL